MSDFGLAKRLSSDLTRSQAVMGTPQYMAPEQAGGKAKFVGPAADVYALGVILYECLTGKPPFCSEDAWSLIRQVLDETPEPLRKSAPGVPRDLELICLKCLEKEPHHRYPSAAALADDLGCFLRGEPVSVRPIGVPTRVARWAKRHPAPAALVALVALLLVVVPPLVVWQQGRLERSDAVAVEARQKEAAAKRAEAEEHRARVTAERLAQARELFALQTKLRGRAADRLLGWALATRAELPQAVRLADEPEEVADLRSIAAAALLADDLQALDPVARGMEASALAADPKSGLVAVGEHKSWGLLADCRILLIDPASGRVARQLTFSPTSIKGGSLLDRRQDGVRVLAFSSDGRRLFAGTRSSRVLRFDLDSSQNTPALEWKAAETAFDQLAVAANGNVVYGVCRPEPRVFAWDAETGKPLRHFAPPENAPVHDFALLPSGDVVACNGHKLYRWSMKGKLLQSEPNGSARRLAATPGSMLLVGAGAYLDVCDRESLAATDRFADANLRRGAHEDSLRAIVVHPSGAFAATQAGDTDRTVKVWSLGSGRLVAAVAAPGTGPIGLAWSADGAYLLATAVGRVERWRFVPAEAQRIASLSAFPLDAVAFLSDGRVAALGESSNGRRELLVGMAGDAPEVGALADAGGNGRPALASEPGGLLAATLGAPGILLWKPGTPVPPPSFAAHAAWRPQFGSDGRTLWAVVNAREVRAFDPVAKSQRGVWDNSFAEVLTGLATLESLAGGHELAAAAGRDGTVYLLNAAAKLVGSFPGAGDPVLDTAVAPDDSVVAAGTQKGLLRVIHPATKFEATPVLAHPGGTTAVTLSHDGTLLATGGRDRAVRLWKRTGDRFEPLLTVSDLPCAVRELQFSPTDGRLLVLLTHAHTARVWDIDHLKTQLGGLKLGW